MITTFILFGLLLVILIKRLNYKITNKIEEHLFGFIIYYILFGVIIWILLYSTDKIFAVNDFFTSILLIVGILISFAIFLTNRGMLPSNLVVEFIHKTPEHIPFSHALKSYLLSLLKINYKVKVLLRTPDENNYIWILNHIAAYNEILANEELNKKFKDSIEFILLDNKPGEIDKLFNDFNTDSNSYIVITSLSAIFKDAIMARDKIIEYKQRVKIIGALSSISNDYINKIINSDDNIIRVFPPDYDEANTAINFIFYRIISSVCVSKICDHHNNISNIVVLHSGSYGSAISRQCEKLYESEKRGLKYFTNSELDDKALINNINYYSFNFTNEQELINDALQEPNFDEVIESMKNQDNWFYIVGYEPNISIMLKKLNRVLNGSNKNNYFLFSGTSSMHTWRQSILDKIETLDAIKDKEAYYLKLKFCSENSYKKSESVECKVKFIYKNNEFTINDLLAKIDSLNIGIDDYCGFDENYISILTKQSLKIAKEVINNPDRTLLSAKYSILQESEKSDIKLLVNGDSINQYEIEKMK